MPPRTKGRGAREQHKLDRRDDYTELVVPQILNQLEEFPPESRLLLVGDGLAEYAKTMAPKVAEIALLVIEYERWQAACELLADHANVRIVQELNELDDPDGFEVEPWTAGVMLLPYHLGFKEMHATITDFMDRLKINAPVTIGGSRTSEWASAQERIGAMLAPLTTLYRSDPVYVVRGLVRGRAGLSLDESI